MINSSNGSVRITESDFDGCVEGIWVGATNVILRAAGLNFNGQGAAASAINFGYNGAIADISDFYATNYLNSIMDMAGGTCDVIFGNNCWFDNWNIGAGGKAAMQSTGAPTSTSTVKYSTATRFTNANGGPNTGGPATFTTY